MLSPLALSALALSLIAHADPILGADVRVDSSVSQKKSGLVSQAWYAGWHGEGFPLDAVSWEKYTHLTYSFGVPTNDVHSITLDGSAPDLLPKFVQRAHREDVKAIVSLGGWIGSLYFSSAVATKQNRTAFVKTVTDFATKYKLDGIDIDWEYPGNQGIGCNTISPNDTTNLLAFLRELRAHPVGKKLILTAATSIFPWKGADGQPLKDVSGFAQVFDWIAIMNYDIWGSWSASVGPNAPLNDACAAPENQQGSATSAVAAWAAAGMPKEKMLLGVPSYGHSFLVKPTDALSGGKLVAYPPFNTSFQPVGDRWDDQPGTDVCGNPTGPGGVFNFFGMMEGGFLDKKGKPLPGIHSRFDTCSQTPFVYNATLKVLISYDDAKAFAAKGKFIKDNKLRGFAIWEAAGDSRDILLDSIRKAAGFKST